MAEQDSEHIRCRDKEVVAYANKQITRGQYLGFLIGLSALLGAGFCAHFNQPIPASLIGVSGVVGLVSAFLKTSTRAKQQ